MDQNRVEGTLRDVGGRVQESVGRAVGDSSTEAEGIANQIQGTAQDIYGRARDGASAFVDVAADSASNMRRSMASYEGSLRGTIKAQPWTAVLVALGIGWLMGRIRQPL